MMKKTAIFLVLGLFLASCTQGTGGSAVSPSASINSYELLGNWVSGAGRHVVLAPDGSLEFPGEGQRAGKSWEIEGNALILTSTDAMGGNAQEERFQLGGVSASRLRLVDMGGQKDTWRKADKQIAAFNGKVIYRERMALPENVQIQVGLYHEGSQIPFASSLSAAIGQGEIPFTVHYLIKDADDKAVRAQAVLLVGGVPYLSTPEPVAVHLEQASSILLRRVAEAPQGAVSLVDSYWRLTSLDGKHSQTWPGQSEPHVIFRSGGQAVGSDGCNNFFAEWQSSGDTLSIILGGSTLKMCLQGMDQAKAMMDALKQVRSWSIQDGKLVLSDQHKSLAGFEVVALE